MKLLDFNGQSVLDSRGDEQMTEEVELINAKKAIRFIKKELEG